MAGLPREARPEPCPIACDTPLDRAVDTKLYGLSHPIRPDGRSSRLVLLYGVADPSRTLNSCR